MLAPNEPGRGLMPRATVHAICAKRDLALKLYAENHAALCIAGDTGQRAYEAMVSASGGGKVNSYTAPFDRDSGRLAQHFLAPLTLPSLQDFAHEVRAMVDRQVWAYIIRMTDLERLMDKTAKDQFRKQLTDDPPECTVDNVTATLQQIGADAGLIFRRGIAKCFSDLDRRFRSHDAFKIGARVILDRCFGEWGAWSYHTNKRDSLIDIERVFVMLDGKKTASTSVVNQIEAERQAGFRARQSEHLTDYFKIRIYKNGNLHIWFTRDDLVRDVNRMLGEYYGEQVPDATAPEDDGGLYTPKTSLAKNFGFFPTPEPTVAKVIEHVPLYCAAGDAPLMILEPSAGTGRLASVLAAEQSQDEWGENGRRARRYRHIVDCVEIQPELSHCLRLSGFYRKVTCTDFLTLQPTPLYDRVVMNPPFDRERDIDHVIHALEFLKPDGFLCAIMSAATEFRETRKSLAFRKLMTAMNARWVDLPAGSFASAGTYINTLILRVWKDGRTHH